MEVTKERLKALKSAKCISARLIKTDLNYPYNHEGELQLNLDVKVPGSTIEHTVNIKIDTRIRCYDKMFKNKEICGFFYDLHYIKPLLKHIKVGDKLELEWLVGSYSSESLAENGIAGDSLVLTVRRSEVTTRYLIDVSIAEAKSPARPVKLGSQSMDYSRVII